MTKFRAVVSSGKILKIILLSMILMAAALIFGQTDLAKGIFVGGSVAIFNVYIVADTVQASKDKTPHQAQNLFMLRAFARMFISLVLLLAAVPFGVAFFMGVSLGLVLQMLVYTVEAIKLIAKGVSS